VFRDIVMTKLRDYMVDHNRRFIRIEQIERGYFVHKYNAVFYYLMSCEINRY
jgi:hypothetical protein